MFTRRRLAALVLLPVLIAAWAAWKATTVDAGATATVRLGSLDVHLTESGVLRPAQSIAYRSPLGTRETEVVFLAPEGLRVNEGDMVARLDTRELQADLGRARQSQAQTQLELQVAIADREDASAELESLTVGEKALELEEAQSRLRIAERKIARLNDEVTSSASLLERGFITRDELERSTIQRDEAEAEIGLARRRVDLLTKQTYPRERQRASRRVAQQDIQLAQVRQRLADLDELVRGLTRAIDDCRVYARRPGMVVHDEFLASSPRRKIRVGDRVTASQGLVTIPDVAQMVVESSIRESDVHLVKAGQAVMIRMDAFPDLRLTGLVSTVGALAKRSESTRTSEKRFELIVAVDADRAELRPEMTARLELQVSQRARVLVVPVTAVFEREGLFVAHVLHRWSTEMRYVELGASNDIDVEIVGGLHEGERVSLIDTIAAGRTGTLERP